MKKKLLLFLSIFTFIENSFAQLDFDPSSTYGAGSSTRSLFSADFNNDGYKDIVTANSGLDNVSILLGSLTGTLSTPTIFATGANPYSVFSADFNGDGNMDIVSANHGSNNLSVLLGNGTGSFSSATSYATGTNPYSVFSADFNGDGKMDLVTANSNSGNISVLLGSGTGTFGAAVNFSVGTNPQSVFSADFNGDGKMDLSTANYGSNNVSVLLGTGIGTFSAAVNYSVGTNPSSLFSADFNNDGKMDIVTANFGSYDVSVLIGNGTGTFAAANNYAAIGSNNSISSADYNGDGNKDLVVTGWFSSATTQVILGNGDGSFSFASGGNLTGGGDLSFVTSADFNNDGKIDLATTDLLFGEVAIWLNSSISPIGAALNFDGINDRVSINNPLTNSFTLETYIKTSTPSATGSNAWQGSGIMDADVPGVANDFILSILNNRVAFWDGSSNQNVTGSTPVTDGTWKHVALTRAAGGQIRLYVNGVLEASGTAGGATLNANPLIYFGNNFNAGTFSNISMDETRIWNRVLCQAEIQNNLNGELPPGQFGLLAYYKYNQGISASSNATVTTLNDASGNANNGTLNNFALAGTTSNWISPGAVTSGSNVPAYASTIISISGANSICSGASTTFTASGAVSSYTWISGPTTATISVSPTLTTTYSVVGTNGVGCISNIATKTLTVNALPTASITGTAEICNLQSTVLTATGGSSYVWSTGANTSTISVNPSTNTVYTATVTSAEGCTATATRIVTVNPLPTPTISGLNNICVGQTTTLTAAGGGTYLWSNGATTSSITVNPAITTAYTATVTSASGCTATASRNVTVNNLPTPNITGIASICEGQSTTLTASGGVSYTWNTGANTATINVNPSTNTAYTSTVTNASGCSATAVRIVTVNALPTASITGTAEICNLQSTILTATGGSSYVWSTGANTSTISVNPSTNTVYTATVTSAGGCTATATRIVTVNPLPTPSISGLNNICVGQTTTLTATGGGTYLWSTGATTSIIAVSPTVTTLYTATVTSALGCTATASRNVNVNNLPTPSISGIASICEGQSTTLTASGGVSYMWNTGANTATINVNPPTNTAYTATVTNASGCKATAVRVVTVNTLPVISVNSGIICLGATFTISPSGADTYTISGGSNIVSPTVDATYNVTGTDANGCVSSIVATSSVVVNTLPVISVNSGAICAGQSFTMVPSGAVTYTYSNGGDVVTPSANDSYTVTGTDANGCVSSTGAVSTVTVNALPTISVNSGVICAGQSFTMVPSGAVTYTYSNGGNVVTPSANDSYTVTGTDANGCVSSTAATSSVVVNALPVISVNSGIICLGATFTISPSGADTYTISGGSNVVSPIVDATYNVAGTDANGCENIAISTVSVNALPTVYAITNNTLLCVGETSTLTVSGASTYTWSTGSNGSNVVVNPITNTVYTVTGTDMNGCSNSASVTQSVSLCTGINQLVNESSFNVFPNPFTDAITIKNSFENYSITIVDVLGKVVIELKSSSQETSIDLSYLTTGLYQLIVKGDNSSYTHKIVKQ